MVCVASVQPTKSTNVLSVICTCFWLLFPSSHIGSATLVMVSRDVSLYSKSNQAVVVLTQLMIRWVGERELRGIMIRAAVL